MLYVSGKIATAVNNKPAVPKNKYATPNSSSLNTLEKDTVSLSRTAKSVSFSGRYRAPHNDPIILVNGVGFGVDKDNGEVVKFIKEQIGPTVRMNKYKNIIDQGRMEVSGQIVSEDVNKARVEATKTNLAELSKIKGNPDELADYFAIDARFTDKKSADTLMGMVPGTIEKIEKITKMGPKALATEYSTRVKKVEDELAASLKKTDFGNWNPEQKEKICKIAAGEITNAIAPKAMMVGHSAGGFISRMMVLNPKKNLSDKDPFHYDAGNGINIVSAMSSPQEEGVRKPCPSVLENTGFDIYKAMVLEPMEKIVKPIQDAVAGNIQRSKKSANPYERLMATGMQSANSIAKMQYDLMQSGLKAWNSMATNATMTMMTPMTDATMPGTKQIARGSDFIKQYVKGKSAPDGVTCTSVSHPQDGFLDDGIALLNEKHKNNHNLVIQDPIKDADVQAARDKGAVFMTAATLAHYATMGDAGSKALLNKVQKDPDWVVSTLDSKNAEAYRKQCLDVILDQYNDNDAYFKDKPQLLEKIKEVSKEGVPVKTSASFKASFILKKVKANEEE